MKKILLLLLLLLVATTQGQQLVQTSGVGAPTGYCNGARYQDIVTGIFYNCTSNAWQPSSYGAITVGAAAAPATIGAMTVPMTTRVITVTPTGAATFNASGGMAGQMVTFAITTSGVSSFVLTWGTNFKAAGTLATGTVTAKKFSVTFICTDGVNWQETGRTPAM